MLEYQRLKKQRRKLLALTGLTPKEFGMLLPVFSELDEQARADTTQRGTARQRAVGAGAKGSCGLPSRSCSLFWSTRKPILCRRCWAKCSS